MKNKLVFSSVIGLALIFGIMAAGCDNGNGSSSSSATAEWDGTYSFATSGGDYVKLSDSVMEGKIEGVYGKFNITIGTGGNVVNGGTIGKYVFILRDGSKIGIFWSEPGGKHVAAFRGGVANHILEAAAEGASFSPAIVTSEIDYNNGHWISADLGDWPY